MDYNMEIIEHRYPIWLTKKEIEMLMDELESYLLSIEDSEQKTVVRSILHELGQQYLIINGGKSDEEANKD